MSETYRKYMGMAKEMFTKCDANKDGLLNSAEFMNYKQCEHDANVKMFGDNVKGEEHWNSEYALYNKICPDKEGISFEDLCQSMAIWGCVMEEMMKGSGSGEGGVKLYTTGKMDAPALVIKMALRYVGCNVEYCVVTEDQFKTQCPGKTLPCMCLADGTEMQKRFAILRYVCAANTGK